MPLSNLMLEALPPEERKQLLPLLEAVPLPLRMEIYSTRRMPRHVYFPTSGMASVVTEMEDGEGVEVGLVAREAMVGSVHLLGPQTGQSRAFMQIGGTGLRMDFRRFQGEFERLEGLHRLVLRQVQAEAMTTAQLAACNRLHNVEERLARWLLMVAARIGSLDLGLTQEFLGAMLGARRSTVTLAAGALQRSGLIELSRGMVRILDRDRLEDAACECLQVTQRLLANMYSDGHSRTDAVGRNGAN